MSNFELVQKLFPTFMMIIVICIAGFIKTSIKQDKIRMEQRKVLVDRVARENALLERERFLQQHEKFLESFLEYENHCNKIHSLIYPDPGVDGGSGNGFEVKLNNKNKNKKLCCPAPTSPTTTIQAGDRAPLNYAIIYVFVCILVCLLVQAIIDVSKEIKSPQQETTKFSLKDYAQSSSSRRASVRPMSRMFASLDESNSANKPANFSPTRKRSSFSNSLTRRPSLAQYLLKGNTKNYRFID